MVSRFEVRVGREFEHVVVISIADQPKPERRRSLLVQTLVVAGTLAILGAVVYGLATGDFRPLRGIAESGEKLVAAAAKAVVGQK